MGLPTGKTKQAKERHAKVAEAVVKEGKSFRQAMIGQGYSHKVASLGQAYLRKRSSGLDMAFVNAAKQMPWRPEEVKAIVRARLVGDVTSGKSSGLERACELLGRDKSVDMWVRNAEVQIGIMAGIVESSADDLLPDPPAIDIDKPE